MTNKQNISYLEDSGSEELSSNFFDERKSNINLDFGNFGLFSSMEILLSNSTHLEQFLNIYG